VARQVRQQQAPRPLLVAVAGYDDEADRRLSERLGIGLHLTKPVDPAMLEALLARCPEG
jgi:CheY-like chemotaxis protein